MMRNWESLICNMVPSVTTLFSFLFLSPRARGGTQGCKHTRYACVAPTLPDPQVHIHTAILVASLDLQKPFIWLGLGASCLSFQQSEGPTSSVQLGPLTDLVRPCLKKEQAGDVGQRGDPGFDPQRLLPKCLSLLLVYL